MIQLTEDEFVVLLKHAQLSPDPDAHSELIEAAWSIYKRNHPEGAAALAKDNERKLAAKAIVEIEAGTAPSPEAIQLYANILTVFGPNATFNDLAEYGSELIAKSETDVKN
jgi:hypothetical protein